MRLALVQVAFVGHGRVARFIGAGVKAERSSTGLLDKENVWRMFPAQRC